MKDNRQIDSTIDPFESGACTCANLRKASRAVTQAYDVALQPVGLKATQYTVLATLEARGDGPLTQLADALVMDRTTLTRNLKPLLREELVRIDQGADLRVREIGLTDKGKRTLEEARPHWVRVQSRFAEALGQARWSSFLDDLATAITAAQKA